MKILLVLILAILQSQFTVKKYVNWFVNYITFWLFSPSTEPVNLKGSLFLKI